MRLALGILLMAAGPALAQDEWRQLPLSRVELSADSTIAAGIELVPSPGAIDVVIGLANACKGPVSATYQARGAVVKIRVAGLAAPRQCPAAYRTEAYRARVAGLKPKRYQVVAYTQNAKRQWLAWKAGVTEVPAAAEAAQ
jgi:hypothetical protein